MIKKIIEEIEKSKIFNDFREKNNEAYLAHAFFLLDEANKDIVQIGYFNKASDKITTFVFEKGRISKNPEADVFKEQKSVIKRLDILKVKIEVGKAIAIADGLHDQKYSKEAVIKKIAILQHLPVGQVWNITYLLSNFKTLNIKIDSANGNVLEDTVSSLVEIKSKEP